MAERGVAYSASMNLYDNQKMKSFVVILFTLLNILSSAQAAERIMKEQYIDSNSWILGASIGYGKLSNPLVERDDIPLYILPDIRYYGNRLSLDNLNVSYSLLEKPGFVVELVGSQNQDGIFFPGDDRKGYAALAGHHPGSPLDLLGNEKKLIAPKHRSMSYLAGVEMRYYGWLNLFASWQSDVSNVHHGHETRIRAIKHAKLAGLQLSLEMTAVLKSKNLIDYYYSVDINESANFRNFYSAGSTTNYLLKVNFAYPLSKNFAFVGSVQNKWLGSEISDSPVVIDDSSNSFFVGIKYVL